MLTLKLLLSYSCMLGWCNFYNANVLANMIAVAGLVYKYVYKYYAVADPGFPVGGVDLVGGRRLLRRLRFKNFYVETKESGPLRGGGGSRARPLDPPMYST